MANTTGKKFGGRQKGTPNRLTKELRAVLKDLIHEELETLQERMDHLDPKERLEVLVKLLPYILPKSLPGIHTSPTSPSSSVRFKSYSTQLPRRLQKGF